MFIISYFLFLPLSIILLYLAFNEKMRVKVAQKRFVVKAESFLTDFERWYWVLFIITLIIGIFVRVYRFCELPKGTNQDGAMAALEAFYLMHDGVDTSGFSWPTYFEAWMYTNMSTLYSWLMIPFIKVFGNTVLSMRLPPLIIGIVMLPVMWDLGRRMKGRNFGLLVLFLVATNPWQMLQTRWGIESNIAPHFFVLGFYFLYIGLDKKPFLFLSMIIFGLTVYAYGLASILVPAFLLPTGIYMVSRKKVDILSFVICIILFAMVSGCYYWTMVINAFGLETVKLGPITMPFFEYSRRSDDVAMAQNYGITVMADNASSVYNMVFQSNPENAPYDAIDWAHTMYRFMPVFVIFGVIRLWRTRRMEIRLNKESKFRTYSMMLLVYFAAVIFTGLQCPVNITRSNCLFYCMILISAYTVYEMGKRLKLSAAVTLLMIGVCFIALNIDYFTNTAYQDLVGLNFRSGLFTALKDTWGWDYDEYVIGISSETEKKMIEPTVQYAHEIDYKAKNEDTDLISANGEHTDWYYSERYVYVTNPETYVPDPMSCSVYVMYKDKYAEKFDETDYLLFDYDQYIVAYPRYWAE